MFVHSLWFVKYMFSTKIWFVKSSTKIVKYESRVVKSNPIAILKNFVKFTEKDLCQSLFLKHPAPLKEYSGTSVFLWILKSCKNLFFCKMPSGHCFCSLKDYSESIQNLPLEYWYNNLKTRAEKFVLVKVQ